MSNLNELFLNHIQAVLQTIDKLIPLHWLMLDLASLVFLFSALLMIRGRRQLKTQMGELKIIQKDIRAITAAALGVGERVLELDRRQRQLSERQEQSYLYDPANQSYEQAIRMVQSGAQPAELVDVCGLSENEAELISLMHRLDEAS